MNSFPLFPLYENVLKKYDNVTEDLDYEQKEEMAVKIKKMDANDHEILYTIIKIYFLDHNKNVDNETFNKSPYNSKIMASGLKFYLDDLPPGLQNILYNFLFKIPS